MKAYKMCDLERIAKVKVIQQMYKYSYQSSLFFESFFNIQIRVFCTALAEAILFQHGVLIFKKFQLIFLQERKLFKL